MTCLQLACATFCVLLISQTAPVLESYHPGGIRDVLQPSLMASVAVCVQAAATNATLEGHLPTLLLAKANLPGLITSVAGSQACAVQGLEYANGACIPDVIQVPSTLRRFLPRGRESARVHVTASRAVEHARQLLSFVPTVPGVCVCVCFYVHA